MLICAFFVFVASSGYDVQAKMVIKMPHGGAATKQGFIHNFALKFVELAAKYSNNDIEVQVFPANQLGTDQVIFQKVRFQEDWIVVGAVNNFAPFSPSAGVLALPYLYSNMEEVYKLINGPIVD